MTLCTCGHPDFDHGNGKGRCIEPSKRCRCTSFRECDHPKSEPWNDRMVCTVCGYVQEVAE